MRRAIAHQMALSAHTTARVTLFMEVDMTAAMALREELAPQFLAQHQVCLSPTHLIIVATARALKKHLIMNARWSDDTVQVMPEINIGIAVALEEGLVVPVLRRADNLNLLQVGQAEARLSDRARARTLSVEELTGGTFTISNLGMFGVDCFTPIINTPEAAILGIGRIAERPAVREGCIVPRSLMDLCLSFDHRVVDGAPAAAFLASVRDLLEESPMLVAG
jgi:pyruvate dehydrogenase E2 component (dihydrolipoamide acetyltransferase)